MIDYNSTFYSMSIWVWVKEAMEHCTPKGYAYWGSTSPFHINLVFIVQYEHYFHTPSLTCVLSKFHNFRVLRTPSDSHCQDPSTHQIKCLSWQHVARKLPERFPTTWLLTPDPHFETKDKKTDHTNGLHNHEISW